MGRGRQPRRLRGKAFENTIGNLEENCQELFFFSRPQSYLPENNLLYMVTLMVTLSS